MLSTSGRVTTTRTTTTRISCQSLQRVGNFLENTNGKWRISILHNCVNRTVCSGYQKLRFIYDDITKRILDFLISPPKKIILINITCFQDATTRNARHFSFQLANVRRNCAIDWQLEFFGLFLFLFLFFVIFFRDIFLLAISTIRGKKKKKVFIWCQMKIFVYFIKQRFFIAIVLYHVDQRTVVVKNIL